MEQPVFFGTAFEGLYVKALGARIDGPLREALRREGLDLSKPLLPAYPHTVWQQCLHVTAKHLYPQLQAAQAMEALGTAFVHGFSHTLVGSAVVAFGRVVGVRRALQRFAHNTRSNSNLYVGETTVFGPGHVEVNSRLAPELVGRVEPMDLAIPHVIKGIIQGIFELLRTTPTRVELTRIDLPTHTSVVTAMWNE